MRDRKQMRSTANFCCFCCGCGLAQLRKHLVSWGRIRGPVSRHQLHGCWVAKYTTSVLLADHSLALEPGADQSWLLQLFCSWHPPHYWGDCHCLGGPGLWGGFGNHSWSSTKNLPLQPSWYLLGIQYSITNPLPLKIVGSCLCNWTHSRRKSLF